MTQVVARIVRNRRADYDFDHGKRYTSVSLPRIALLENGDEAADERPRWQGRPVEPVDPLRFAPIYRLERPVPVKVVHIPREPEEAAELVVPVEEGARRLIGELRNRPGRLSQRGAERIRDEVIAAVSETAGISRRIIVGDERAKIPSRARHLTIWILRITLAPFSEVRLAGLIGRENKTVFYALRKIPSLLPPEQCQLFDDETLGEAIRRIWPHIVKVGT